MKNKVLFLDRDGTINVDNGYLTSAERLILIPKAAQAIIDAKKSGFLISIITNQAGYAKGLIPHGELEKIHSKMVRMIASETHLDHFEFDDIQMCLHHPKDKCRCRKPETEMLEKSAKNLSADLKQAFFVGDKLSDLLCAHRMGVRPILVETGHGKETLKELEDPNLNSEKIKPWYIAPDLMDAVNKIKNA